jgi:transcriptional regulator with XRE-family HTH domain
VNASSQDDLSSTLGDRIREARKQHGLTQEALAGTEFTKGYVSALERGAVRPSLKALEVFARRLNVPITDLLSARQETDAELEISALLEDLTYQFNYAKMLIRTNQVDEAFQLIADVERSAQPSWDKFPPNVRYLFPFTRGHAYLQQSQPMLAKPELEEALKLAMPDKEAVVQVRNLLGVVFYEQAQPHLALEQHLLCLRALNEEASKDLNLRLGVFRNLANDYWAANDPTQAAAVYKEALNVLEDVNDLQRQAGVYWGLAMAYKALNDWPQAKLYATRALYIYEAADNRSEAASMCINLAEILIDENRLDDAQQMLERAKEFLTDTGNEGLWSFVYRYSADLARRKGQLEVAAEYARESVKHAEALREALRQGTGSTQPWVEPVRIYAEALHVTALVEESLGHREAADQFFGRALDEINQTTLEESVQAISFSYAEVLEARGDYKQAAEYYRTAAQARARAPRPGT